MFDDDEEEYDDPSCPMGGEWGSISNGDGEKCFNAAKTWYLGWFSNYHGFSTPASNSFKGTLVGINDAGNDEISSGQYVSVKISGSRETDLFMMYNRVEGVHKFLENVYYRDKVVVVEQSGSEDQSWVRAVLDAGETYSQSNWDRTGNALKIKVCVSSWILLKHNISPLIFFLLMVGLWHEKWFTRRRRGWGMVE